MSFPTDIRTKPTKRDPSRRRSRWPGLSCILLFVGLAIVGCTPAQKAEQGSLHAVLPATAKTGEFLELRVAVLGSEGTPDREWKGSFEIGSTDTTMALGQDFRAVGDGTYRKSGLVFREPGFQRVTVRDSQGRTAVAGPVYVVDSFEELADARGEAPRRLYFGDCHGHSTLGDGTHSPQNYFYYARDVAFLDFTSLSEHDYQQFLKVGFDTNPAAWDSVVTLSRKWRRPNFSVLLGWEWSSRKYGHRVVLFPNDESKYVSFRDAKTPQDLADRLEGTGALSVIAHPLGSRLTPAIDWDHVVPGFDQAIEIYSGHGLMDEVTEYRPTSDPVLGRSVRDGIREGFRFSIVGFSDTHLSTPGNPSPPPIRDAPYRGGLTGVWTPTNSEDQVLEAMRSGKCYGTTGERFLVNIRCESRGMGERYPLFGRDALIVEGFAAGPHRLGNIDFLIDDEVVRRLDASRYHQIRFELRVGPFEKRESLLWMRGADENGERFWTSPIRVVRTDLD